MIAKGSCQVEKKSEKNSDWSQTHPPIQSLIFLETFGNMKPTQKTHKKITKKNKKFGLDPPTSEFFL